MSFDPNAYAGFDPEAYAGGGQPVGMGMAGLRGAAQGATLGFGDEMEAGWKSLLGQGKYSEIRDKLRADEQNARSQHPYAYGTGEVVGGTLPGVAATALTGGAASPLLAGRAALGLSVGQGAAQGAGYSDHGDARSLARDTALGAGVGLAGYGAGQAMGAGSRGLARFARSRSTAATARATDQAAQEITDALASAKGSLGGEVQKGSRQIENMMRLEATLTPEQRQVWNELQLSSQRTPGGTLKTAYETGAIPSQAETVAGRIPQTVPDSSISPVQELRERVAQSTLDALPAQAGSIASKDAELAALKSGASDALKKRTAELLSPAEAKGQLLRRLLRYGPVAAGTAIGTAVGGPIGSGIGALAGAGTRPMIQSMVRLGKNPAVQKATFDALEAAARSRPGDILRQLLSRGGTAAATQSLVEP